MDICVEAILYEQKFVFIQMLELYQYDFSEFLDDDINEYGYFGYAHIDDYWNEEGRHPFFIRVNGKLAGLVLVRSCCEHNTLPNPHCIAEFFADMPAFCGELLNTVVQSKLKVVVTEVEICEMIF